MPLSPFFARVCEFAEPTTAFDEATAQIVAAGFGEPEMVWAFLTGKRGGTFAGDIALEISRGRGLEAAIARSIARWCRWTVNRPMAAQLGCAVGTTFLAAAILEANPERNAA